MITLYGRAQSRSFRCVWALLEADVPFNYVHIDRENLPDDYTTLSPQTKVPTLVDGELVMNESAAIVNYAGSLSSQTLIPKDRARYDELSYFVMTELEQPLWSIGKHSFALPEQHRVKAMLQTAAFEYEKAQKTLLLKYSLEEFALGSEFTLVDVVLAQTVNWAKRFEMPVEEALLNYRDRLYMRPACVKALKMIEV